MVKSVPPARRPSTETVGGDFSTARGRGAASGDGIEGGPAAQPGCAWVFAVTDLLVLEVTDNRASPWPLRVLTQHAGQEEKAAGKDHLD